jgi:hypothetical protein
MMMRRHAENDVEQVVNETEPLHSSDSEYSGLWYAAFAHTPDEMFIGRDAYAFSANLSSTTLIIDITQTSHYIKNTQSPIAKQAEVVFRTLLFAFLCLELCAMAFLIFKLVLAPL